ncbi:MAG: helix-turn-helix domain-containing protein [Alistipes sp.]|nr:helix-turn-helix domain-containing protein [Alistipes sp.]
MYQLAEMIGITPESLTRALMRNPQFSTLKAIADALGVPVRELFSTRRAEPNIVRGTVVIGTFVYDINGIGSLNAALEAAKKEYERLGIPSVEEER